MSNSPMTPAAATTQGREVICVISGEETIISERMVVTKDQVIVVMRALLSPNGSPGTSSGLPGTGMLSPKVWETAMTPVSNTWSDGSAPNEVHHSTVASMYPSTRDACCGGMTAVIDPRFRSSTSLGESAHIGELDGRCGKCIIHLTDERPFLVRS